MIFTFFPVPSSFFFKRNVKEMFQSSSARGNYSDETNKIFDESLKFEKNGRS
jgi:hypothetical protein